MIRKEAIKTFISSLLFSLVLIFCLTTVSAANTIYVNTTGNDSWTGNSSTHIDGTDIGPKATIQNGINTVDPNGFVYVADGTYQEHITINQNLTLIGQSLAGTIIDGTENGRPLTINSGLNVTITNFTITNGTATAYGGGIYNEGTLTMTNCNINNNTATSTGVLAYAYGGGIYNSWGTLTMTDCNINNNTATSTGAYAYADGGGIYNVGTLSMTNCNINNNTATATATSTHATADARGGGIYNVGTLTMTNCNINNNTATATSTDAYACGGGIYNMGMLSMTNCNINDNTATATTTSAYAYGGGIYNYNVGTLSMTNCNINDNTATATSTSATAYAYGGGIYNSWGTLSMTNCNINDNTATATATSTHATADARGGGIYNYNVGTLTMTNCNINNNTATATSTGPGASVVALGGGIYNDGTLTVNFSRIVGNSPQAIYRDAGDVRSLENNWWGINNPDTDWSQFLSGITPPTRWIVLGIDANPSTIYNTQSSTVTANLLYNNNGDDLDPANGHVPDGIPVTFYLIDSSLGTLSIPTQFINGKANVTFTATAVGTQFVNCTIDNQNKTATIEMNPIPVTKTGIPSSVNAGELLTYNMSVENEGPSVARNVSFSDALPGALTNAEYSLNGSDWFAYTSGTVIGLGDLPVNETVDFWIRGIVDAAAQPGTITNTVNVFINGTPSGNATTNNTVTNNAALNITKTPNKTTAKYNVGDMVTYTIKVNNSGISTAHNVVITDTVPNGLQYVGSSDGGSFSAGVVTWNVGNIAGGAQVTRTVTFKVLSAAAGKNIVNTATAIHNLTQDPVSTTASIYVPSADLVLSKTVDNSKPKIKDTIHFTLIVNNRGPDTAVDVKVTDKLPAGLSFLSYTANYGTYDPQTGIWTIGNLPNGARAVITITSIVENSGEIINVAKVTSLTYDPNIDGNTASVTINVQKPQPDKPKVDRKTVPMQPTGIPIAGIVLALLILSAGFLMPKRKQ